MLSKKYRLTKNGSFSYVYRKGQVSGGKLITLTYVGSKGAPKVGFSVPNKVGKAVVRGKLKRRMRAVVRGEINRILGAQMVFSAKAGAAEMGYTEIKSTMLALMNRARLLGVAKETVAQAATQTEK